MPAWMKSIITDVIATIIYFPLARLALLGEKFGLNIDNWLLSLPKHKLLYNENRFPRSIWYHLKMLTRQRLRIS